MDEFKSQFILFMIVDFLNGKGEDTKLLIDAFNPDLDAKEAKGIHEKNKNERHRKNALNGKVPYRTLIPRYMDAESFLDDDLVRTGDGMLIKRSSMIPGAWE